MNAKPKSDIKEAGGYQVQAANAATQAANLGPPKLSDEAVELFKVFEAEIKSLRRKLSILEDAISPYTDERERWLNKEIERRLGLSLEKPNALKKSLGCEVSPMDHMRFRYNIGA